MTPSFASPKFRARLASRLCASTMLIGGACGLAPAALANPIGGVVVGGQATISNAGTNTVTVGQSSQIVIIDWSSFNIAKGETTRFLQPGATATAVNRIGGDDPSVILGELDANGRVILINGNGLLFGAGAKINVGSLIATTHDASNADLMNGKADFNGSGSATASITNNGQISAASGMVGLIAPAVANNGLISAKLGSVTLGAASRFTLDFTGDGLVSFPIDAEVLSRALDATGKPVQALVANSGRIDGATVVLTAQAAKGVVEDVISMGGVIRASGVRQSGGSIVLDGGDGSVSVSGTLDASDAAPGAKGGSVVVLGSDIALAPTARLDASGNIGGGSILVGGNLHGAGPLPDATNTTVAAGATLSADALTRGDGGQVVVWSSGSTNFAGAVSARGGALGGDGGMVETSGKQSLTVADGASVNTLAPKGAAGDWLLDPANITVASSGAGTLSQGATTSDTTSTITISTATIDAAASNVILAASNAITVSSAISMTGSGVGITFEGAGGTPTAGPSAGTTLNANITTTNGDVTFYGPTLLGANVTITAGTGAVDFAGTIDGAFSLTVSNSGADTFGGDIGDSTQLTSLSTGTGATTLGGAVSTNNGAVTINGPATLSADLTVNAGTGNVAFNSTIDGAYNLTINNTGTTTFAGDIGDSTQLASVTTGTGTTTLGGAISTNNGDVTVNGAASLSNDVTITAGTADVTFNGTVDGAHSLTVSNSGALNFYSAVGGGTPLTGLSTGSGVTTLDGSLTTTNGAATFNGQTVIDVATPITISTGTGNLDFVGELTGDSVNTIINLTVDNTGSTTFGGQVFANHGPSSLTVDTDRTYLGGKVTISGGAVAFNSPVTLDSDITVTSTTSTTFGGTVDGAFSLTTLTKAIFDGVVGGVTPLTGLATHVATLDANVTTTNGAVTFNNPVTLGGAVTISTGTGAVDFASTISGASDPLTIVNTGALTFGGGLTNVTGLSFTTSGTTLFKDGLAGVTSLSTGPGTTTIQGAAVSIDGPVTLGGDLSVNASGSTITFSGAIDGAHSLTTSTTDTQTFNAVGATTPLTSLTTGTGPVTLYGSITTANGALKINGSSTTLEGDVTLSAGSGAITVAHATTGNNYSLTLVGTGGATLGGVSGLGALTTESGLTSSSGAGFTITGATTLDGDLSVSAGGQTVTFGGAVDGAHNLSVTTTYGVTTFGSTVGASTPLASLNVGLGAISLNGNISTTNGAVTLNGVTTLGADVTVSAGTGAVTFDRKIDGAFNLTVTNSGATTFAQVIGGTTPLMSLTTGTGTTTLDSNVTTANGAVTLNGPTTLGADVGLTTGTGAVDFVGAVDGAHNLTISNSGEVTFGAAVGANAPLLSLATGTGATTLDGNVSTTNGSVTFNGPTILGADATITAGTGAVDFTGTVNGAHNLTISNSGGTTFGAAVGGATPLLSLTTGTGGTTLGGNVSTTNGGVTFNDATTLGADVTVTAGTGAVDFAGAVDGAHNLTISTSGSTTFGAAIGATTPLLSLATGTGATTLDGNVSTTNGAVTFNGATTLGADVTVAAGTGAVDFVSTVDGAHNLTISNSSATTFGAAVGGGTQLLSLDTGTGATTLDGNVSTANGAVTINGTTTLGASVTLSTGTGAVDFVGAVNGAHGLTISGGGSTTFGAAVGASTALASLATGTGATTLNGNVTTTGLQSYGGPVALSGAVTISTTNAAVSFASTIDTATGAPSVANLTVTTGSGAQTYDGALGGTSALGAVVLDSTSAAGLSLASTSNHFASVDITGGGAVTVANAGALSVVGIGTPGDILVSTQSGDLTINGAVTTTSATSTALTLEAGRSADRVASPGAADTNGDVVIASGGGLSVGAGGFGRIYTGSITGSTGLSGVVAAGGYRYWSDTNGDTGYTTSLTSGISAIYREQPEVTVSEAAAGSGRAYDRTTTTPTLTTTGQVNGDTGSGTATVTITSGGSPSSLLNAGSYVIGVSGASPGAVLGGLGYAARLGTSTTGYVIAPVTVSITGVVAADKTYDGTTTATLTDAGSLTGLVGGETLALTPAAANFADANAGVGKTVTVTGYSISNGSGLASNYVLASTTATTTATIDPAVLTSSLTGTLTKTYDGTTAASLSASNYTLTGTVFGNDAVALNDPASGSYADAGAGSGKTVTVTGLALNNSNYILASTTASAAIGVIDPAVLTAGLTGTVTKTYDGTTAASLTASNYTLTGTVFGNDAVALNDPASGAYADAGAGSGKTVTVTGLALNNSNYVLASTTASAAVGVIDPAVLTAGLTGTATKTYDGTTAASLSASNYTLTGTVFGNDAVALNDPASGAYADANAGTGKTVTVTGLALNNSNYVLASTTASAAIGVIDPAVLTAGLTGTVTKTYDGMTAASLSASNYTLSGTVFGGDAVALNDPASGIYADANPGSGKTVTVTGLALNNSNYMLASTTISGPVGVITPTGSSGPPAPPPSSETTGLTSVTVVTYEAAATTNVTIPTTIFPPPLIQLPTDLVSTLYADFQALVPAAPQPAPSPAPDKRTPGQASAAPRAVGHRAAG